MNLKVKKKKLDVARCFVMIGKNKAFRRQRSCIVRTLIYTWKTFLLALCITCHSWPLLQNWAKIVEPRITTRWGENSVCVQFQRRIYLLSWIWPCWPKVDPLSGRRSLEWSFTKVYGWANCIDCKDTLFRCSSCSKSSFFIGCTYFILKICLIHLSALSTNFFNSKFPQR